MPDVVNAIVCERISSSRPLTLTRVRKRWRTPPASICVYLEIHNPSERPYDLGFELWRRNELIDESGVELIPVSDGEDEHAAVLEFSGLEAKSYFLDVLLSGERKARIVLDFGHPKALR